MAALGAAGGNRFPKAETGAPGKEGFLWQDEDPGQGWVATVRMGLPADLSPYGYNGLPGEGTVPCPLLGMGGTHVGPQLWVQKGASDPQKWQNLSYEEGSVLAGTFGGISGAVPGVEAGSYWCLC